MAAKSFILPHCLNNLSIQFNHSFQQITPPTSGIQKAIPQPLGRSRSHPAPQEFSSFPTCLPGWWTSKMGMRPCGGVGLSLEPGTSNSLLMRFSSFIQNTENTSGKTEAYECRREWWQANRKYSLGRDWISWWHLLRYLIVSDVVPDRPLPQETLTAMLRYSSQHQLAPLLLIRFWGKTHRVWSCEGSFTRIQEHLPVFSRSWTDDDSFCF